MVYIHGDERYCRCCGTFLGRKKALEKRGHEFCDMFCYEVWQEDQTKVVDFAAYRMNGG